MPKRARLSPSVPPLVKTISAGRQFTRSATCSRARSTAARACWPCWWIEEALPNLSKKYGRMASNTSGRSGLVALLSRYTLCIVMPILSVHWIRMRRSQILARGGGGRGYNKEVRAERRGLLVLFNVSALSHGHIARGIDGSLVLGTRTDQAIVAELLHDVGGSAGNGGNGEDRSEQVDVDAQRVISRSGVEVDVSIELAVGDHELLDLSRDFEPFGNATGIAQVARHGAQMPRTRIFGVIHTMPETRDLFFLREHDLYVFHSVGAGRVDGLQDAEDRLVGATMQGTLERPNRGGDGRVHVAESRGDHAGSEGGSVELVIGVQDESNVKRARGGGAGNLSVELIEEVRGVGERAIRFDQSLAFADAVEGSHDVSDLRSQANGLAQVGLGLVE